jgi:hypothetical protein
VHEPVEDCVGEGRLSDDLVPGFQRELAGNDGRPAAVTFLDDFHEVAALHGREAIRPPIVEDQQSGTGKLAEQPVEAAIATGEFELGEEPWQPMVENGRSARLAACPRAQASQDFSTRRGR